MAGSAETGAYNAKPTSTVIREEDYIQCVHCGMCLEHCPTYRATGLETESPRGRIYLMRSLAEGKIAITENFETHISKCLDCRACEVVCPSGVTYGRLVESGKQELYLRGPRSLWRRFNEEIFFGLVFPSPKVLDVLAALLFFYQRALRPALQSLGMLKLFPRRWRILEAMQPPMRPKPFPVLGQVYAPIFPPPCGGEDSGGGSMSCRTLNPPSTPSPLVGGREPKHRVAFLAGCVMRVGFPGVNEATVEVLRHNGCEVVVPKDQVCCGALNVHAGERARAVEMMKRNIDCFLAGAYDAIIVNAAGCGAAMKGYGHFLRDDPGYRDKAAAFSAKVKDFTEFLAGIYQPPKRRVGKKVVYQDACHLANAQRISREPRELLRGIPGLELLEMTRPDQCCGSAGIYNIVELDLSLEVLKAKVKTIQETGAEVVVSANPGCISQIRYGLEAARTPKPVVHIAEILNEAYAKT